MNRVNPTIAKLAFSGFALTICFNPARGQRSDECAEQVSAKIRVDAGNPWSPPFGLDRVGAPPVVHVELKAEQALQREYFVVTYREGRETGRNPVALKSNPIGGVWGSPAYEPSALYDHITLPGLPHEVALLARCPSDGRTEEVARQAVDWPSIEADATARPDTHVNPVDLGAVLVPHDWLLVSGGQRVRIELAAITRPGSFPDARLKVWWDDGKPVESALPLSRGKRVVKDIDLIAPSGVGGAALHLTLSVGGRELWRKEIPTMIVANPPRLPEFGAVEMKLRHDTPIATGDRVADYHSAWDPSLNDIVVFLPNGSRFVFWRGFHYAPFWAGLYNTGFNYEWAENLTHPFEVPGWGTLFPEPLFDHELRYGRVRIVESTSSRIHVRWTYEGTDPHYRRWGEQAAEDYYFYPDGFGIRVMTLTSEPYADYELSEFIVLTPQGAHPFEVLPGRMLEMLYLDGEKRDINFPVPENWKRYGNTHFELPGLRRLPVIYRVFQEKRDRAAAIFFSPRHVPETVYVYQPQYKEGQIATPALSGIGVESPGATCLWTVIKDLPEPVSISAFPMLDTLGRSRELMTRRWAWLIAKTEASDEELLEWAQSFAEPPTLEVTGARIGFPSYVPERRAMRLVADSSSIEIRIKPASYCINPVLEIEGAPGQLGVVTIDGKPLAPDAFAWDGTTLWIKAKIDSRGAVVGLQFQRRID